ncbi:MAG: DUF4837 family protein [Bacteroidales bacterium]|nr:DUF4837 family protein [Bacteroidales bacterium]
MYKNPLFVIILVSSLFFSCKKNAEHENLKPSAKGEANTVVVVISGPNWDSEAGDAIRSRFSELVTGLPQEEPTFDILFVPHANFDKVYKRQRNIFLTQIGPDYKENFLVSYSPWAKPQIVVTVTAPNQEAFVKYFTTIQDKVVGLISDFERERLMSSYSSGKDAPLCKKILNKHQIDINIPEGYKVATDSTDVIWLTNEYRDIIESIVIYSYPYTDSNTFSKNYLISKKNQIESKYIRGEIYGSFVTTEDRFPVEMNEFSYNGKYTVELKGLWRMEKGVAMGGPFISITQYDEKRQRIVTAEGFIFAPAHEKRNLVRRVEAVIYSMKFPE